MLVLVLAIVPSTGVPSTGVQVNTAAYVWHSAFGSYIIVWLLLFSYELCINALAAAAAACVCLRLCVFVCVRGCVYVLGV